MASLKRARGQMEAAKVLAEVKVFACSYFKSPNS